MMMPVNVGSMRTRSMCLVSGLSPYGQYIGQREKLHTHCV
jgi:hypothetical protein